MTWQSRWRTGYEERRSVQSNAGWVAGVYGGRGTGKTSFLWTLVDELKQRTERAKQKAGEAPCVMPAIEHAKDALLIPAATRDHDDLLFLLLKHVEQVYGNDGTCRDQRTRGAAQERSKGRGSEEGHEVLHRLHARGRARQRSRRPCRGVQDDVATTTKTLRQSFTEILKLLSEPRGPGFGVLPLFIDDIDLQPQRALELLEIVHLFLNVPGVVVMTARSRPSAPCDSKRPPGARRGAPWARIGPARQVRALSLESLRCPAAPSAWRRSGRRNPGTRTTSPRCRPGGRRNRRWAWARRPRVRGKRPAEKMLGDLLPSTFRGLVALHNRLLGLMADWDIKPGAPDLWQALEQRFGVGLAVPARLIGPFVSMAAAVDVRHPELRLMKC